MTEDHNYNRRKNDQIMAWERHFATIVLTILSGVMLWVGTSLTKNIDTTARTDVRLSNIEDDLAELKADVNSKMKDRFTGEQATRLIQVYDQRFADLEKWSRETERRIDVLEQDHHRMGVK